ncbi:MAG: hypothetical protein K1X35_09800 [Caulobacteraceae bacterium]|nr:hypothetical protein [Caulobacteraceae bacterium]
MFRSHLLNLAAAAAVVSVMTADAAAAGATGLDAAFGNTVVSTYPDGRTALLWLKPDGTYDAMGRRRTPSSGTWALKGDKVCLKQKKPRAVPFTYCTAVPTGGVGASWTGKAVTGEKIRIKLVAGRIR